MKRLFSGFLGVGLALALMIAMLPAWITSAAIVGTASITSAPAFTDSSGEVDLKVTATNSATGTGTPILYIRTRQQPLTFWLAANTLDTGIPVPYGGGSFSGTITIDLPASMLVDGNKVDLLAVIEDAPPADITTSLPAAQATVTIDTVLPVGWVATAPLFGGDDAGTVYCSSFLMYGVTKDARAGVDHAEIVPIGVTTLSVGASAAPNESVLIPDKPFTFTSATLDTWEFYGASTDNGGNLAEIWLPSKEPNRTACKSFSDIGGHFSERHARYLASAGAGMSLFAGYPNGTFGPDLSLTRAELATTLVRAAGLAPDSTPTAACTFTDVGTTDWFRSFVTAACQAGLMTGMGGGLFGPNNAVTRGEAAVAINNLTPLDPDGWLLGSVITAAASDAVVRTTVPFTDVTVGAYYATAVTNLYGRAIINGTGPTTFSPDSHLTRGQLAVVLYRALGQVSLLAAPAP